MMDALILVLILVLATVHVDRFDMSVPMAFTIVICYLWLLWTILSWFF